MPGDRDGTPLFPSICPGGLVDLLFTEEEEEEDFTRDGCHMEEDRASEKERENSLHLKQNLCHL